MPTQNRAKEPLFISFNYTQPIMITMYSVQYFYKVQLSRLSEIKHLLLNVPAPKKPHPLSMDGKTPTTCQVEQNVKNF